MKLNLKSLEPSAVEYVAGIFLTLGVVLLANSRQLLNYYGLQSSNQVIQSSAGSATSNALKSIDSLRATDGVVTFLIWAMVGIVCFGIVEAIGSGVHELKLERQLSSARYIHPATFTKAKFWHGVLVNAATLAFGLVLLAAIILEFSLFVLPLGLAYCRPLLYAYSPSSIGYMLVGLVIIYIGLLVLDVCVRLLLGRRRVFSL